MANDIGGVWRTIGGRRVFIKDGQDLASAMKESGKFKNFGRGDVVKAKQELKNRELHQQTRDMENAFVNNRYKLGTDYWSSKWNEAREYERHGKEDLENYDNPKDYKGDIDDVEGKHISKEQQRESIDREIEEWTRYRDKYQNSLNRATNPDSKERFKKEIDDSNRTIERLKEQQKTANGAMNNLKEKDSKAPLTEDSWKNSSPEKAKATLDNARVEQQKQQDAWDKQVEKTKNDIMNDKLGIGKRDDDFASISKELQEISSRTGKSDLFSEAGKRWNELYKQDKNNVSKDLGDGYKVGVGYGGRVTMNSSHPYDDTNYAWAEKKGDKWQVNNPTNRKSEMFNSRDEALKEMKNIDKYISTGEVIRSYEGIKTHSSPKISYEDFKKNLNTNYMNKGIRDAYEKYKNKHPNSKMTFTQFKDNNK